MGVLVVRTNGHDDEVYDAISMIKYVDDVEYAKGGVNHSLKRMELIRDTMDAFIKQLRDGETISKFNIKEV